MSDLSADELTVLLIAAKGESMMPIGRWEAPVKSLLARGYLHANDKFNNFITDAGRRAVNKDEDDTIRQMIGLNNTIVEQKTKLRGNAEQIATQLVDIAESTHAVTGEPKKEALERWARIILTRALEMIG